MWYNTDPEKLKNYQYKGSLKKAKEELVRWRYNDFGKDLKHLPPNDIWRKMQPMIRDNLWYTGISSNLH